ncbi:MAG TPA: OadG family transporter subunit [Feifaniaceae bacterium]|nr:OadG family transporter subunit [Feifaniaceae bacterium]
MTVQNAILTALFCFAMVFVILLCLYLLLKLFSALFAGVGKKEKRKA